VPALLPKRRLLLLPWLLPLLLTLLLPLLLSASPLRLGQAQARNASKLSIAKRFLPAPVSKITSNIERYSYFQSTLVKTNFDTTRILVRHPV
jgi:hypothetical protein